VNFPTRVYENSPELVDWLAAEMLRFGIKPEIEAFDLSMLFQAAAMQKAGKIKGPLHVQFVMGVKNAMPVDRATFEFYAQTLRRRQRRTWEGVCVAVTVDGGVSRAAEGWRWSPAVGAAISQPTDRPRRPAGSRRGALSHAQNEQTPILRLPEPIHRSLRPV